MESMHPEASCTRDVETYSERHLKGANFQTDSAEEAWRLWIWHKYAQLADVTCHPSLTPFSSSSDCQWVQSPPRLPPSGMLTAEEKHCNGETVEGEAGYLHITHHFMSRLCFCLGWIFTFLFLSQDRGYTLVRLHSSSTVWLNLRVSVWQPCWM